jgi:hypothetical protein
MSVQKSHGNLLGSRVPGKQERFQHGQGRLCKHYRITTRKRDLAGKILG